MNHTWKSFLQTVFQFVKSLFVNVSKKMHRDAVVLTVGVSVVTVITFTAGDFRGGGRNALVAFAETPEDKDGEESDPEEPTVLAAAVTESELSQSDITDSRYEQEKNTVEESTEEAAKSETEAASVTEAVTEAGKPEAAREQEAAQEPEATQETEAVKTAETDPVKETEAVKGTNTAETAEAVQEESSERIPLSDRDYKVLLKIVQAEAGGCDRKGRILVANVILNRVESDEFPDNVTSVVYEKYQFSPVMDGSLDRCKISNETVKAVECALTGEDYSDGALYFMNRRMASSKNVRWFDSHLNFLFKHGNHEFFK